MSSVSKSRDRVMRSKSSKLIPVGYGPKHPASGMLAELRRVVARIPRGKVATYGAVAEAAGYPGAARQVAWALHNNSQALPWHRVLGAGGNIRLPGASGLEQRLRLEQEGVAFRGRRVDMERHAAKLVKKSAEDL